MKPALLIAASALALGAAACQRPAAYAMTHLDCPARQGGLTRVSVAADGKTCAYRSSTGADVDLRLIPVSGSPQATLAPIEQQLRILAEPTEVETAKAEAEDAKAKAAKAKAAASDAKAGAATAKADADAARTAAEAERVAAEAASDAAVEVGDDAGPRHHRRHVHGDNTRIDLPGLHVAAENDSANVRVGPIHVNAEGDGATVRVERDVRLRGEALSRVKRGFRATYVLAGDSLKNGYRFVGYEAGGPRTGPLTVAVVTGKSGSHHDLYRDVNKLVRHNGGV